MKSANAAVSASEVSQYLQCPRRWAAAYRWDRWPTRGFKGYFKVGSLTHGMIEGYCKTGAVPSGSDPLVELFLAGLPHLPAPLTHWHMEKKDTFEHEGLPILVIADWVGPQKVVDFKTSKDPKRYGVITKEQKLKDPQTLSYAHRYICGGGTFDHVYLRKHRAVEIYYEDKTPETASQPIAPQAFGTPVEFTAEEVRTNFENVFLPPAERVFQLRNKHARIDPLTLPLPPVNPETGQREACSAYGGCEYRTICFPKGDFSGANLTEHAPETKMSLATFTVRKDMKFKLVTEQAASEPTLTPVSTLAPKFTPFKKPEQVSLPVETMAVNPPAPEFVSPVDVELEPEPALSVDALIQGRIETSLQSANPPMYFPPSVMNADLTRDIGETVLKLVALLGLSK